MERFRAGAASPCALSGSDLWTPVGQRAELHRRIAERKQAAYGGRVDEIASELAFHCSRANDKTRAATYFQLAGEGANRNGAPIEAERHYDDALKVLLQLPETRDRDRRELALQTGLGMALGH